MRSRRRQTRRVAPLVTHRKRSEETRQISDRLFGQFFANLPVYCYMISPRGNILDVNLAACEALGYEKEELLGKPLSVIYASQSRARIADLLEKWNKAGGVRDEEMVIVTKRGEKRTVLLSVGSILDADGKLIHSTSVQVDITERKRMEEKLRETQMQLTDSIASVTEAIERHERPPGADSQTLRTDRSLEAGREKLQDLTKREREILHLLVCGVSTRRMAQLLDVRLSTVRNHLQNILSKLELHSRLECVAFAHRVGFELRNTPS